MRADSKQAPLNQILVGSRAAKQVAAPSCAQDGHSWIRNGPQDAIGLFLTAELEPAVHARHHDFARRAPT
jgi:hypothetical protein